MEKMYGGSQYAAVHGRVEDDFIPHCRDLSGGHPQTAIQAPVSRHVLSPIDILMHQ